jgi:hypothetical protein
LYFLSFPEILEYFQAFLPSSAQAPALAGLS